MRTLLLLLLSISAFSQSVKITVNGISPDSVIVTILPPKPIEKVYTPFPTSPVFTNYNTVTLSGNQSLFSSGLAGKTQQLLTGKGTNLTLNGIGGTLTAPIVFKGGSIEGTSTSQRSIRTLNATYHFELYDMTLVGNDGGVMLSAGSVPAGVYIQNIEILNPSFAGYWCNSPGKYDRINSNFLRIKNTGGEGIYIGNTSPSTRSTIQQSHHENLFVQNTGWDGVQFTSINDFKLTKATILNTGIKAVTGQNRLIQVQYCNGLISKSIFSGSTSAAEFFTNGLVIEDTYFGWDNADRIYIGNPSTSPQTNGKPIIFRNCIFRVPVGDLPLVKVAMRNADVVFENCTISDNIKSLFSDNRGTGATNKLIDAGGNRFLPASQIPSPEFHGELVADDFYYRKGWGYRTP